MIHNAHMDKQDFYNFYLKNIKSITVFDFHLT